MKYQYSPKKNILERLKSIWQNFYVRVSKPDTVKRILLEKTQLFTELDNKKFTSLLKKVQLNHYPAGSIIFKQGDVADYFYLIKTGVVRIYVTQEHDHTEITLARLIPHNYFGEQALLAEFPGKRSASAKVMEDTTMYVVPHHVYSKIIKKELTGILKQIGDKQLFVQLQKQLEQFSIIDQKILHAAGGKVVSYQDGQIIFRQEEEASHAYFIISGHVLITLETSDRKRQISELAPGQLFGELGVLRKTKRIGTAYAKGDITLLSFDAQAFKNLHSLSSELQQLTETLSHVYRIAHYGTVNLYYGRFLDMPAISAFYQLENGRSVTSAKVISKPLFTMSYNNIHHTKTLRYTKSRALKRELIIQQTNQTSYIVGIMAIGEWDELPAICQMLLNATPITAMQMQLFTQEGTCEVKFGTEKKSISPKEREETLCYCMHISKGIVYDAIREGLNKVGAITLKTGAGSVCGSCRPQIVEMLGLQAWTTVKLTEVTTLHPEVCSFKFQPINPFSDNYQPGQYITIQALINDRFINRNYTITSVAGYDEQIEITVKKEPEGYFSPWLFEQLGQNPLLRVSSPQGEFTLNEDQSPVVCFVGGIGVTPALAFARYFVFKSLHRLLYIDYSAHVKTDFLLLDEWERITREHKNITIHFRATNTDGKIQNHQIYQVSQDFPEADYYICGPHAFEQLIKDSLLAYNVQASKLKIEKFIHSGSPSSAEITM